MPKLVVWKEAEPEIGIIFTYVPSGTRGKAQGWHGACTECGKPMHFWSMENALYRGQRHVDDHDTH